MEYSILIFLVLRALLVRSEFELILETVTVKMLSQWARADLLECAGSIYLHMNQVEVLVLFWIFSFSYIFISIMKPLFPTSLFCLD